MDVFWASSVNKKYLYIVTILTMRTNSYDKNPKAMQGLQKKQEVPFIHS